MAPKGRCRGGMPKSIYVIAILGLGGCIALSLMMKNLVEEKGDRDAHPMAREVQELFGGRLEGNVDLQWEERDGIRFAVLTITPAAGSPRERLAKDMAQYVWRRLAVEERPERFEVECLGRRDGTREIISVPLPAALRGGRASPRPRR